MHVLKLVFCLLLWAAPAGAETARIAVAANFRAAMQDLQTAFQAGTPHSLQLSTGSTGQLFAQIVNGAPFDVFLSADQMRPAELVAESKAVPESRFTYARGRLYLLLPEKTVVTSGMPKLYGIRRVAIANPRTAPYGMAATQVLGKLVFPDGKPLIAQAQSVAGVNAAMATGAVDAGFAAFASVATLQQKPAGWLVPRSLHDPIDQDAVLLQRAVGNAAAVSFMAWLKSDEAAKIIRRHGYHVD